MTSEIRARAVNTIQPEMDVILAAKPRAQSVNTIMAATASLAYVNLMSSVYRHLPITGVQKRTAMVTVPAREPSRWAWRKNNAENANLSTKPGQAQTEYNDQNREFDHLAIWLFDVK